MDKLELSTPVYPPPRRTLKDAKWKWFLFLVCIGSLWYMNRGWQKEWSLLGNSSLKSDEFNWSQINPSEKLVYTSCFGTYQCARLSVPMDWNSTSSRESRVALAVVKMPAAVPVTDHRYGGVVLLNPGGPGGSGVDYLLRGGRDDSATINPLSYAEESLEGKYFDLISWDPRGVNNTSPDLQCFHDSLSYDVWKYQQEADGTDNTNDLSLSLAWARWKALMETCAETDEITKHMNTVHVVRDMVEIIERHAEWRSDQAELWLASKEGKVTTSGKEISHPYSRNVVIDRTKWHKGGEKLQYWGFSYGTLLGQTFAAIQPNRVGRMVLDGVVDAEDYYHTGWMSNLRDTDKIMSKFYEYCSSAGPDKCALNIDNSSASDIQNSVEKLISSLHEDPISVPGNITRSPSIITYSDVLSMIRQTVYQPLKYFPEMAELLADLVYGDGTASAVYKQKAYKRTCPLTESQGEKSGESSCQPPAGRDEVTRVIACSDGRDISSFTKEDFKVRIKALYQQSKYMGDYWSTITLPCMHWKVRPKWGITAAEIKGKTSHPILWVGNTLDPVTPLANAHSMSKRFPGSVVLQQDSEGHCSTQSPSVCTQDIIRNYFQTGDLPAEGTICQPNELPLVGNMTVPKGVLSETMRFPLLI